MEPDLQRTGEGNTKHDRYEAQETTDWRLLESCAGRVNPRGLREPALLCVRVELAAEREQGRIQPVSLGGAISVIFGSQVSSPVHYCKRDEAYFTTLLWQNNWEQNGLKSRMLFSEWYKIMVNKVTFLGFRGAIASPGSAPGRERVALGAGAGWEILCAGNWVLSQSTWT